MNNRSEFLDRKVRRKALGLEEADIENHMTRIYGFKR